jgi:urease accessory protein UreE
MQKDFNNIPLSESNVSLRLADIQKRCTQLLQESGEELELALEEPVLAADDGSNPYNRG